MVDGLSIVLPAYNEQTNIGVAIKKALAFLPVTATN